MKQCLDEATLQSYFDGELSTEMMESATMHIASCEMCDAAARELEQETNLLTNALASEFAVSVPTERLRQRIDAAVLDMRVASAESSQYSTGGFFSSLAGLFSFGSQRTLGYASLAIVLAFAAIFAVVKLKTRQVTDAPTTVAVAGSSAVEKTPTSAPAITEGTVSSAPESIVTVPRAVSPNKRTAVKRIPTQNNDASVAKTTPVKLLPGERAYLQTIAKLDTAIKSDKNPMRPGLQAEYQRNLAVVDRAIAATRSAAKSNPNDPDAADFMFAAYQSKVDLLNTIADAGVGGRSH